MRTYLQFAMTAALCGAAIAQETSTDRLTVPFSNPTGAKTVRVNVLHGAITVRGYDGNEVIIEGATKGGSESRGVPQGMRRIPMRGTGLEAEEENNIVRISTNAHSRFVDMTIQVPRATSLQLKAVNSNQLVVDGVEGDIEANCTNGKVILTNVSGSVIAHSLNGGINATLNRVGSKPMSFSTLNGNIDVTLPADIKARVKLKTDNGDAFTDFDLKTEAPPQPVVQEDRTSRGKYRITTDRSVYGTINGGGIEMSFTSVNGRIYLRKK